MEVFVFFFFFFISERAILNFLFLAEETLQNSDMNYDNELDVSLSLSSGTWNMVTIYSYALLLYIREYVTWYHDESVSKSWTLVSLRYFDENSDSDYSDKMYHTLRVLNTHHFTPKISIPFQKKIPIFC